jgi:hypothetical protein
MDKILLCIAIALFIFMIYYYFRKAYDTDHIHYNGINYAIKEGAVYELKKSDFDETEHIYFKLTNPNLQLIIISHLENYKCDFAWDPKSDRAKVGRETGSLEFPPGPHIAEQYLASDQVQIINLMKGTECYGEHGGKIPQKFIITKKNNSWNNYVKSIELNKDKIPEMRDIEHPIEFATS